MTRNGRLIWTMKILTENSLLSALLMRKLETIWPTALPSFVLVQIFVR